MFSISLLRQKNQPTIVKMKLSLGIFLLLFAASGQAKIGSRTLDDPIATTKANVSRPYPLEENSFWTDNDQKTETLWDVLPSLESLF